MLTVADKIDDVLKHRKAYLLNLTIVEENRVKIENEYKKIFNLLTSKQSQVNSEVQNLFEKYLEQLYPLENQLYQLKTKVNQTKILFNKDAINIGVSGSARVGKSTLLKSISGLSDTQIPTGDSLPVTAVKSTIEYSDYEQIALIEFHSETSFLQEVIGSYHKQLGISTCPSSLDEFRRWAYPSVEEIEKRGQSIDRNISVLKRLLEIRDSIFSFKHYLSGKTEQKFLEDIKPFVSYPEEAKSSNRPYLAVKKVHIRCKFPMVHIKKLILMDLPGLGDLGADIESHHVDGLKNNIDVVLMVKKSTVGQGFWQINDTETLDLLRKAKPISCSMQDFVFLIVNEDSFSTQKQVQNLIDDIQAHINQNPSDKQFQVINCNLMNADRVHQDLMMPVLNHLAKILPGKDLAVLQEIEQQQKELSQKFKQIVINLGFEVDEKSPLRKANDIGELQERVTLISDDLNNQLSYLYSEIKARLDQPNQQEIDFEYFQILEDISSKLRQNLIENDLQTEKWKTRALDRIRFKQAQRFSEDELNRIRVVISKSFSEIDVYLNRLLQKLFMRMNEIFTNVFQDVFRSKNIENSSKISLTKDKATTNQNPQNQTQTEIDQRLPLMLFAKKMENDQYLILKNALENFVQLKIEFKSDYLPYARKVLNMLEPIRKNDRGQAMSTLQPLDLESIERFRTELSELTRKTIFEYQQELQHKSITADEIIFASLEELADALRDKSIQREITNLVNKYKHLIWKDEFEDMNKYQEIINQIREISSSIV